MKQNNFKQTLKYSLRGVRIMQLRENSNSLTKKKPKKKYVTFCLSAAMKWNTQAYLKLLSSFTSQNDIIIIMKEKEMVWNAMNSNNPQQELLQNQ